MAVCVKSEIGALKKVLLQRPGRELEHLSPNTMEQLLFDDIPYLYGAPACSAQALLTARHFPIFRYALIMFSIA